MDPVLEYITIMSGTAIAFAGVLMLMFLRWKRRNQSPKQPPSDE